jgi:hypothetical protein
MNTSLMLDKMFSGPEFALNVNTFTNLTEFEYMQYVSDIFIPSAAIEAANLSELRKTIC